jgi:hypothetical protein
MLVKGLAPNGGCAPSKRLSAASIYAIIETAIAVGPEAEYSWG